MAEKPNPFYKPVKAEVPINITSELKETFDSVNKALSDACKLALKQAISGKQLVLMTGASFRSAGYAFIIEENPKDPFKKENVRTRRVSIKCLFPRTTRDVNLLKRISGNLHGLS